MRMPDRVREQDRWPKGEQLYLDNLAMIHLVKKEDAFITTYQCKSVHQNVLLGVSQYHTCHG
jgi:hypothetical protein